MVAQAQSSLVSIVVEVFSMRHLFVHRMSVFMVNLYHYVDEIHSADNS